MLLFKVVASRYSGRIGSLRMKENNVCTSIRRIF